MPYVSATVISGPPEEALKVVRDALVANAFTILSATPTEFTAAGPGLTSSRQNSLLGASKVSLRVENSVLHLQAELGGAARLGLFATLFPLALGVFLAVVLGLARKPNGLIAPLLAVGPWLVVGPLMAVLFRKRTEKALNALLQSTAAISANG